MNTCSLAKAARASVAPFLLLEKEEGEKKKILVPAIAAMAKMFNC